MPFSVMTYNIQFGGKGREEAILSVLRASNADIISLTEADDPQVVAALAEALDMHHRWAQGSGDRHIATLSRYEIQSSNIYNTPPLTQAVLETTHNVDGEPLTVYNLHFLPYLLLPYEVRRWQAVGKLLRLIREKRPGPHLILGDINAIGPGDRVLHRRNPAQMQRVMALQLFIVFRLAIPRLLKAGYVDCFRHLHASDNGFTWMTGNRTTRYDYILACPKMIGKLQTCRVLDEPDMEMASDHYPLYAVFGDGG